MKYTLITGASSGIGQELAHIMAKKGHNLILVARRKNRLDEIKKKLEKNNVEIKTISQDLSQVNSAKELYDKISAKKLQINILVNNAGFGKLQELKKTNLTEIQEMMHLNIVTPTELTHLFLTDLMKNKGRILNVASIAAFLPGPQMSTYYATKAYLSNFSIAMNEELKTSQVSVSTLYPGPTKTQFAQRAKAKVLFNNGTDSAKYVAMKGYEGMMNRKIKIIPTFKLKLGVILMALIPDTYKAKIAKKMHEGKL